MDKLCKSFSSAVSVGLALKHFMLTAVYCILRRLLAGYVASIYHFYSSSTSSLSLSLTPFRFAFELTRFSCLKREWWWDSRMGKWEKRGRGKTITPFSHFNTCAHPCGALHLSLLSVGVMRQTYSWVTLHLHVHWEHKEHKRTLM